MCLASFEIRIPNDTAEVPAVQDRILEMLNASEFSERDCFAVRLAVEEALINAVKHGNGLDPEKSVYVACKVATDSIRIEIEDEGPGFHPEDVPDPTDEENLDKPGGRGLMLMRAFMTSVSFNEQGNRVILEKQAGVEDEE